MDQYDQRKNVTVREGKTKRRSQRETELYGQKRGRELEKETLRGGEID